MTTDDTAARSDGEIPDTVLLLEHPPMYTKGRHSTPDELPMGEEWYRLQGIEVTETDPVPEISMTVDDVGRVDKTTGVATISGTYTCDGTADFVVLQGSLQQEQGATQVSGDFVQENLACGGTFDWSAAVTAESGGFVRGLAATAALTG